MPHLRIETAAPRPPTAVEPGRASGPMEAVKQIGRLIGDAYRAGLESPRTGPGVFVDVDRGNRQQGFTPPAAAAYAARLIRTSKRKVMILDPCAGTGILAAAAAAELIGRPNGERPRRIRICAVEIHPPWARIAEDLLENTAAAAAGAQVEVDVNVAAGDLFDESTWQTTGRIRRLSEVHPDIVVVNPPHRRLPRRGPDAASNRRPGLPAAASTAAAVIEAACRAVDTPGAEIIGVTAAEWTADHLHRDFRNRFTDRFTLTDVTVTTCEAAKSPQWFGRRASRDEAVTWRAEHRRSAEGDECRLRFEDTADAAVPVRATAVRSRAPASLGERPDMPNGSKRILLHARDDDDALTDAICNLLQEQVLMRACDSGYCCEDGQVSPYLDTDRFSDDPEGGPEALVTAGHFRRTPENGGPQTAPPVWGAVYPEIAWPSATHHERNAYIRAADPSPPPPAKAVGHYVAVTGPAHKERIPEILAALITPENVPRAFVHTKYTVVWGVGDPKSAARGRAPGPMKPEEAQIMAAWLNSSLIDWWVRNTARKNALERREFLSIPLPGAKLAARILERVTETRRMREGADTALMEVIEGERAEAAFRRTAALGRAARFLRTHSTPGHAAANRAGAAAVAALEACCYAGEGAPPIMVDAVRKTTGLAYTPESEGWFRTVFTSWLTNTAYGAVNRGRARVADQRRRRRVGALLTGRQNIRAERSTDAAEERSMMETGPDRGGGGGAVRGLHRTVHRILDRFFRHERIGASPDEPSLHRWIVWRKPGFGGGPRDGTAVYIHHFVADEQREPHNHPKKFATIGIWGGYREFVYDPLSGAGPVERNRYRAPWFRRFDARHTHRVVMDECRTCWTIAWVGPRVRDWGFFVPTGGGHNRWVDYREYEQRSWLDETGPRAD